MKYCHHISWIAAFISCFKNKEIAADHIQGTGDILIEINATSAIFECSKNVKIRCYGTPKFFVNWQIASSVISNTSSSADCSSIFGCDVHNNFSGRYSYSYDPSTGISDLRISPVVAEDNGREYKCKDGSSPLKAHVEDVPDGNIFGLRNETPAIGNDILFILETNCTTQIDQLLTQWYSTAVDGTDLQIHNASDTNVSDCTEVGDCIVLGKSKQKSTKLELEKSSNDTARRKRAVSVGEGRVFGVNVTYGSKTFSFPVPGRYNLKGNWTLVTNTPAIIVTPTFDSLFKIIIPCSTGFVVFICGIGFYFGIKKSLRNRQAVWL